VWAKISRLVDATHPRFLRLVGGQPKIRLEPWRAELQLSNLAERLAVLTAFHNQESPGGDATVTARDRFV
jgi:hypothetical protein